MACPGVFQIFKGDTKTMFLKVLSGGCAGDPFDLTSVDAIDVAIPNADGTFSHFTLADAEVAVVGSPLLGKLSVAIDEDKSALFNPGELQSFDVTFTIALQIMTVRFQNALTVLDRG